MSLSVVRFMVGSSNACGSLPNSPLNYVNQYSIQKGFLRAAVFERHRAYGNVKASKKTQYWYPRAMYNSPYSTRWFVITFGRRRNLSPLEITRSLRVEGTRSS